MIDNKGEKDNMKSFSESYKAAGVDVTAGYRCLLYTSFRPNGVDSRDMTLFQDDDGTAYCIHSSDWNRTLVIARLTEDYMGLTGDYTRIFIDQKREAPVVLKYQGRYYMITSFCTGWLPNPALYAVSDSMMGRCV